MKREPTDQERENIASIIAGGDKIGAISVCISIAECGLTEAQDYIRKLTIEMQVTDRENPARKEQKRHRIFNRVIGSLRSFS